MDEAVLLLLLCRADRERKLHPALGAEHGVAGVRTAPGRAGTANQAAGAGERAATAGEHGVDLQLHDAYHADDTDDTDYAHHPYDTDHADDTR